MNCWSLEHGLKCVTHRWLHKLKWRTLCRVALSQRIKAVNKDTPSNRRRSFTQSSILPHDSAPRSQTSEFNIQKLQNSSSALNGRTFLCKPIERPRKTAAEQFGFAAHRSFKCSPETVQQLKSILLSVIWICGRLVWVERPYVTGSCHILPHTFDHISDSDAVAQFQPLRESVSRTVITQSTETFGIWLVIKMSVPQLICFQ